MAEIDKSLPNVEQTINVPSDKEIEEASLEEQQEIAEQGEPVEVNENEDGSVDINYDPSIASVEGDINHYDNLAEHLPDDVLGRLGTELYQNYQDYKMSRKDWERTYKEGLDLLGFKYENRTEPFQGASGATHPVLAEAVTQFQALAYKELLPSEGPVRTQILGLSTPEKEQQSQRVKDFMNYQIMDQMRDYEPDFDQMLFYLPLAGSSFKKVYYDEVEQQAVSKFVPADDLIVPYSATSLDDAEAIIHVVKISENELRKQQVAGFYRDIELKPTTLNETEVEQKERELEGQTKGREEDVFNLLECHINLDLDGFEDVDQAGDATGIKLPYIVTLEENSREVLSIRRNYEANDVKRNKIQYFVHFKFLPGLVNETDVERKERELEGQSKGREEDVFNLLECHVNLDLEGFEDVGEDGEPTGIKLPYVVTVEENSREVLSIKRNYEVGDPLKKKIDYFVHFKFLPGLGFYGFGLIHMIGGLSRTATSALRQLLDAGTLSNLPAGFKQRGIRIR